MKDFQAHRSTGKRLGKLLIYRQSIACVSQFQDKFWTL